MNDVDIAVLNFKMALNKKSYVEGGRKAVFDYMAEKKQMTKKQVQERWENFRGEKRIDFRRN